jgi:hypothetical protein
MTKIAKGFIAGILAVALAFVAFCIVTMLTAPVVPPAGATRVVVEAYNTAVAATNWWSALAGIVTFAAVFVGGFFALGKLLGAAAPATPVSVRATPTVKTSAELAREAAEAATLAACTKAKAAAVKAADAAKVPDVTAAEATAKEAADAAAEAVKQADVACTPAANTAAREAEAAARAAAASVITARAEEAAKAAAASKGTFVGLGDVEAHVTGLKAGVQTLEEELSKILFLMHDAKAKTGQERAAAEAQRVIFRDRFQELIDAHKAAGLTAPAMPELLKDPAPRKAKPASAGKAKPAAKPTP